MERYRLQGPELYCPRHEDKNPLALPLPDFLHELLSKRKTAIEKAAKERNEPVSEYVFPAEGKTGYYSEPRKAIIKVQKDSGVEFSIHDLRRTFVTIAESLDIPAYSLKAALSHKTNAGDVTGGYIQINVERLRKPMQRVASYILTAVKDESVAILTSTTVPTAPRSPSH